MGINLPGLNTTRLLFFPFLYLSVEKSALRPFKINKIVVLLIATSIITILFSAEIRKLVQEVPILYGKEQPQGLTNFIGRSLDTFIIAAFFFFLFTRLKLFQISNLFDIILVLGLLESLVIIFLVIQNPESVIGSQFDKFYLWRNPYFGHKNDWGMILVLIVLAAFIRFNITKEKRLFYYSVMGFGIIAVLFSLSRQAYVNLLLGFIAISIFKGNFKPTLYMGIAVILIVAFQPPFLMDRMDSFVNVGSVDDFQGLSRKVGDLAINQIKSNLTVVPRMFYSEWEYNFSEGFWNGLLHQQGILGLVFHIILYLYFLFRYYSMAMIPVKEVSYLGIMMAVFLTITFVSNFNRRATHLMHYDGKIEQIGFLILFLICITEFTFYQYKALIDKNQLEGKYSIR